MNATMSATSPAVSAVSRKVGRLVRHVEHLVETADLARRTQHYTEHPGWVWSREGYHDGQVHAALLLLAYTDDAQGAGLDEREQLRREEEAASLGRRVVVALHNEADELHLSRFYTVTGRAHHAHSRAHHARARRRARQPMRPTQAPAPTPAADGLELVGERGWPA